MLKVSVARAQDFPDGVSFPDASSADKSDENDAQIFVPNEIFQDFDKKGEADKMMNFRHIFFSKVAQSSQFYAVSNCLSVLSIMDF